MEAREPRHPDQVAAAGGVQGQVTGEGLRGQLQVVPVGPARHLHPGPGERTGEAQGPALAGVGVRRGGIHREQDAARGDDRAPGLQVQGISGADGDGTAGALHHDPRRDLEVVPAAGTVQRHEGDIAPRDDRLRQGQRARGGQGQGAAGGEPGEVGRRPAHREGTLIGEPQPAAAGIRLQGGDRAGQWGIGGADAGRGLEQQGAGADIGVGHPGTGVEDGTGGTEGDGGHPRVHHAQGQVPGEIRQVDGAGGA